MPTCGSVPGSSAPVSYTHLPMTYETLEVSPVQAYTAITSQVMCNNEDYFSVPLDFSISIRK